VSAFQASAVPAAEPRRGSAPAPVRTPRPRPPLKLVPAPRQRPARRTPFVLLVVAVLGAGLVALLLINTAVAQDSFQLNDLRRQSDLLQDREEALEQEVAHLSTPDRLAKEAERLGMRPGTGPTFIEVPGGAGTGAGRSGG
jgi:cell division protein FtsB